MNLFIKNAQNNVLSCSEKCDAEIQNLIHWQQSNLSATTQFDPKEINTIKIVLK